MLRTVVQRRAVRRAVQTSCQAVNMTEFRLLAERVVDLSPRGMLVACDSTARVGDEIKVSFRVPGRDELWFHAEAVVARVVAGQRCGDDGYGAGLEFTYLEERCRRELLLRLAGYPSPVPRREMRGVTSRSRELQLSSSVFRSSSVRGRSLSVSSGVRHEALIPRGAFG
jgi:PilZ domain